MSALATTPAPAESFPAESAPAFDSDRPHRLSRHLHLRPDGASGLLAESPVTGRLLPLPNATQVALVLRFLEPLRPAELVAALDSARRSAVLRFLEHCHSAGLLTAVDENGRSSDDDLGHWEPHDLLFHARSRRGRTPHTVGATYHLAESLPPEPPFKAPARPLAVSLPTKRAAAADAVLSLAEALETRRSRYSTEPVALDALGEFLHRTSRITGLRRAADGETLLKRVYPSGGSLHPLELYVIPARCPDLDPGLYHYRPREHGLVTVSGPGPEIDALLEGARRGTGRLEEVPSVLFVFAARFRRVARKYQGLAYSLILKEVGAAMQTFYLVATDMGLSPCALGTGDSDAFARAAGTDYFREASVGEMILGGPAS